jgi:hypothetical protein
LPRDLHCHCNDNDDNNGRGLTKTTTDETITLLGRLPPDRGWHLCPVPDLEAAIIASGASLCMGIVFCGRDPNLNIVFAGMLSNY